MPGQYPQPRTDRAHRAAAADLWTTHRCPQGATGRRGPRRAASGHDDHGGAASPPAAAVRRSADLAGGQRPAGVAAWNRAGRRLPADAWRDALQLATALTSLARIDQLLPPPSRWGAGVRRPTTAAPGDDTRLLRRIRGLLAKAESTEFPEEA